MLIRDLYFDWLRVVAFTHGYWPDSCRYFDPFVHRILAFLDSSLFLMAIGVIFFLLVGYDLVRSLGAFGTRHVLV